MVNFSRYLRSSSFPIGSNRILILMKDVPKIVRFLQCFSDGKCRFNILKTTCAESKNYVPCKYLLITRLYGK